MTHPSLPNYLALTSGSTHGITDDQPPARHRVAGPSIFSQVSAAHGTWATYAESMSGRCARVSTTLYAVKHNPAAYYTSLASTCSSADLPLGTPTSGPLIQALRTNRLPTFALIVPNMCHDTHDCSVSTGDAWLGTWLPRILSSSAYQAGRTAVFITWDEDDESHGNQVMLLEVAPSVPPGWTLTGRVTHLNLLRTTEDMLGLAALVPSAASMRSAGRL